MRSAGAAIAWEFGRKNRWGILGLAGYGLALGILKVLVVAAGRPVDLDSAERFAIVVVVPLTVSALYFLGVFSFGLTGDLTARPSIYPTRMFTLPVTNSALALWPMLYGSAAMVMLWLAVRPLVLWPPDVAVPVIWPALMAAATLAWTQALTWMPYGLPWLRPIVTVLTLSVMEGVVLVALEHKTPEWLMAAGLVPQLALAYLVAREGITRARRGAVPDWSDAFARLGRIADRLPRRPSPFTSAARAQAWLERRRYGRSLPAAVAMILPFELGLLFILRKTPALVLETLFLVLLTPPFMAVFAAASVRKSNPEGADSYGLTPFLATRPLSSASLVAARLKVTIWSTLVAWLLVLVAVPLALKLSGAWPVVIERAHRLTEVVGTPRAVAIVALGIAALISSTWKQLVQGLCIGLSGREWLVKATVFGALALLAVAVPLAQWIAGSKYRMGVVWNALPWIATVLVCFKLSAAAWIAIRLRDSGVLSDRTLVLGAACWDVSVFALYGLLVWLTPAVLFRSYVLALVAILAVPLARLSAAPLALAWNRHR